MSRLGTLLLLNLWGALAASAGALTPAPDSGRAAQTTRMLLPRERRFTTTQLDLAAGTGLAPDEGRTGALAGWQMWGHHPVGTALLDRFTYGAGLRVTHFRHQGGQGFAGRAGAEGQELSISDPRLTAVNAAVQIRVRLLGRATSRHPLFLGFNIDLGGISFGPDRQGRLGGSVSPPLPAEARPVRGNILLGNTNDRGTLNSEFYLDLRATRRLHGRLSFSHIATGYTIPGNRYQRFTNLAAVGLSYGLGGEWASY